MHSSLSETLFLIKAGAVSAVVLAVACGPSLSAASTATAQFSGNWQETGIWTGGQGAGGAPAVGDSITVGDGYQVTLDTALSQVFGTLTVGNPGGGTLDVESGGRATANYINIGASTSGTGTLLFNGGSLTANANIQFSSVAGPSAATITSGTLEAKGGTGAGIFVGNLGAATVTQTGGLVLASNNKINIGMPSVNGTSYTMSQNAQMQWASTLTIYAGSSLSVVGSNAVLKTVNGTGSSSGGTGFNVAGTVNFTLDESGASTIDLTTGLNTQLTITGGAHLTIDGSAYQGGADQKITLFQYSSETGSFGNNVVFTGFQTAPTLVYGADSIYFYTTTTVPEPRVTGLLGLAALVGVGMWRTRRQSVASSLNA